MERALLVGAQLKGHRNSWDVEDSLIELSQLAQTAGLEVAGQTWQRVDRFQPASLVGTGKVEELIELRHGLGWRWQKPQSIRTKDRSAPSRVLPEAWGQDRPLRGKSSCQGEPMWWKGWSWQRLQRMEERTPWIVCMVRLASSRSRWPCEPRPWQLRHRASGTGVPSWSRPGWQVRQAWPSARARA